MKSNRIVVGMDGNGHFQCAPIQDRHEVIRVLKSISDGEYYIDMMNHKKLEDVEPWTHSLVDWDIFINEFTQRGICEIVII